MQYYFMINAKLPSLNEYINACRRNKYQAAKFKRDVEELIGWAIIEAKSKKMLQPTCKPLDIVIKWHCKTQRMDTDNVQSSQKYILDALQKQKIIPNDNRKYVKQIYHQIIDDEKDFVEVFLYKSGSVTLTIL